MSENITKYISRAIEIAEDPFVSLYGKYVVEDNGIICYDEAPQYETTNLSAFPTTKVIFDYKKGALAYQHWFRFFHAVKLAKKQDMYILDLGAGDCLAGHFLYRNMRKPKYVAIDLIESRLFEAICRGFGKEQYMFIQRDLTKRLPFDNEVFDLVLAYETIEHLEQKQAVRLMQESYRVLKKSGIFSVSTPNNRGQKIAKKYERFKVHGKRQVFQEHPYEWRFGDLEKLLIKIGFTDTISFGLDHDHIKEIDRKYLDEIPDEYDAIREYFPSALARILLSLSWPMSASFVMIDAVK